MKQINLNSEFEKFSKDLVEKSKVKINMKNGKTVELKLGDKINLNEVKQENI